uniref:Uncharacterized protein n=2 Tax=Acrobeloides nanus TaxID=290746 RepID=A0A914EK61_9BILA
MLLNETYVVQANKTVIFNLDIIFLNVFYNSSITIFGDGSLKQNYSHLFEILTNGSLCIEASELKVVYQSYPAKDFSVGTGFMMNYTADFDSNAKCPVPPTSPPSSCEKLSTSLVLIAIFSCIAIFFKL